MSQPAERLLKRMIVPNADLRCTAAELMGDPYWDVIPATPVHGHSRLLIIPLVSLVQWHFTGKSASAAAPSTAHTRTSLFFNSFKESFKEKEKEKEKEPSSSRLLDMSLPWSASKSTPRSPASRPASRTELASRPASRIGGISRPASRTEFTPRVASVTPSASKSRSPESPSEVLMASNRHAIVGQASPTSVRTRTHSRSKSQPKLRAPPSLSTVSRTRKLSTVQASPVVKSQRQIVESDEEKDPNVPKGWENITTPEPQRLISLNSNLAMRRPLGTPQRSPRIASISAKEPSISSGQAVTPEKKPKPAPSRLAQPQTPEANHTRTRASTRLLTRRSVSQTHSQVSFHTPQTSRQTSASKQLSGKPPRTRGRAGVLVDLTGFARNVDLGAHGVGRPVRHGGEKKDRGKENARGRTTAQKENKENAGLPPQVHARKDARMPSGASGVTPLGPKTSVKEQDISTMTIPLAANLSGATTVTRGSVRDRMMDWERERERLREMNRLTDTSADDHGDQDSDSSDDDDSEVEAEVIAAAASAQAKRQLPAAVETPKGVTANVEGERPTTTQTVTTISSSSSNLERSEIEVAKVGVRTSAQILSSRNGSITALGRSQSVGKQLSEGSQVKNESVTDIGLPVEVRRNSESGLNSLKHSVKASIGMQFCSLPALAYRVSWFLDKGMRLYKSSTLAQLTGRATPVWCASPEPIDFEQRRSREEGRFSWENIRPEHEVALDRMNLWIQSVESKS